MLSTRFIRFSDSMKSTFVPIFRSIWRVESRLSDRLRNLFPLWKIHRIGDVSHRHSLALLILSPSFARVVYPLRGRVKYRSTGCRRPRFFADWIGTSLTASQTMYPRCQRLGAPPVCLVYMEVSIVALALPTPGVTSTLSRHGRVWCSRRYILVSVVKQTFPRDRRVAGKGWRSWC